MRLSLFSAGHIYNEPLRNGRRDTRRSPATPATEVVDKSRRHALRRRRGSGSAGILRASTRVVLAPERHVREKRKKNHFLRNCTGLCRKAKFWQRFLHTKCKVRRSPFPRSDSWASCGACPRHAIELNASLQITESFLSVPSVCKTNVRLYFVIKARLV